MRQFNCRPNDSTTAPVQVFLAGGAGAAVAELLGHETRFEPNLTLSGIAQIALGAKGNCPLFPQPPLSLWERGRG